MWNTLKTSGLKATVRVAAEPNEHFCNINITSQNMDLVDMDETISFLIKERQALAQRIKA